MGVLDVGGYRRRRMGSFGGEIGAPITGTLLHYCAKVREPIELSFEVMSGSAAAWGRGGVGRFVPPLLWRVKRHFQPKRAKYSLFKRSYHGNYCMDSDQILHTKFCKYAL